MLNEKMIKALEAKGFKRWTKSDMDRLYINPVDALDFEYDTNKSGHVSGAWLNGEKISNTRGSELVSSKTYIDVNTGALVSNHDRMREAAQEIMDAVTAEIEQAEAAEEAAKTAEATTAAFFEDQIEYLKDEGFRCVTGDDRLLMDNRATGLNPLTGLKTRFRGMELTEEQARELLNTKTWLDPMTGLIESDNDIMRDCALEMIDRVNARIHREDMWEKDAMA